MPPDLSKNDPLTQRWRETFVVVMLAVFFPVVFGMIAFLGASEAKARTTFLANLPYFDDRAALLIEGRQIEHSAELMEDLRRSIAEHGTHTRIAYNARWHRVQLTRAERTLTVFIVRDEGPENKYWIFLPGANGARIGSFIDPHLTEWLNDNGLRGTRDREF
jgi:hypothetical protein